MEINLYCLQYIIVENTLSKHKSGKIFALALCRKIERKTSITNNKLQRRVVSVVQQQPFIYTRLDPPPPHAGPSDEDNSPVLLIAGTEH